MISLLSYDATISPSSLSSSHYFHRFDRHVWLAEVQADVDGDGKAGVFSNPVSDDVVTDTVGGIHENT